MLTDPPPTDTLRAEVDRMRLVGRELDADVVELAATNPPARSLLRVEPSGSTPSLAVRLALLAATVLWLAMTGWLGFRAATTRLSLDEVGVTYRDVWQTRRFGWEQLVGLNARGDGQGRARVHVVLDSEERVTTPDPAQGSSRPGPRTSPVIRG